MWYMSWLWSHQLQYMHHLDSGFSLCSFKGLATGLGDTFEMDVQVQQKGAPAITGPKKMDLCCWNGETAWLVMFKLKCILTGSYLSLLSETKKNMCWVTHSHVSSRPMEIGTYLTVVVVTHLSEFEKLGFASSQINDVDIYCNDIYIYICIHIHIIMY